MRLHISNLIRYPYFLIFELFFYLTGFLKGEFREKKDHQPGVFAESQLMVLG